MKRKKIVVAKKVMKKKKIQKKTIKKTARKINKEPVKKTVAKKTAAKAKIKKAVKKVTKKITKKIVKKSVPLKSTIKKMAPIVKPAVKTNMDYSKAVTPLGDRLVVRLAKAEAMTAGGLYIPDMVHNAVGHLKGEVLAVGQGLTTKKGFLRSMDVQIGDQVLFADHAGTKVIFNSEELFIVNETDVLGVISGIIQK
jgi:chaperonin GroES